MLSNPVFRGAVTPALRDAVWTAILARRDLKARRSGDTLHFRCLRPGHNDKTPSAWARDVMHGCLGCGFMEPLTSLAQELGVVVMADESRDYTVEEYAIEKGLDLGALRRLGVDTAEVGGFKVVSIPYLSSSGEVLRVQYRGTGDRRFWWGDGQGVWPYGLNKLAEQPDKAVLLVEGASDCHAAWQHGVLALGVPGANAWKREWAEFLKGRKVYVWQEPDRGGAQFVEKITGDLLGVKVIRPTGVKDLCELHQTAKDNFLPALQGLFQQTAVVIPPPPSPYDSISGDTLTRLKTEIQQPISAIATPWETWNRACRGRGGQMGLAHKWHVMIAGRSGHGKTMVALNIAASALKQKEKVMFVSLEMDQLELSTRLMAMISGTDMSRLEPGRYFDSYEYDKAALALDELKEQGGELLMNRRPVNRLADITSSIRWGYEYHGARTFVVDYLQLSRPDGRQEVWDIASAASEQIRRQAKELGVLTIGISQFKRATSTEGDKRPEIEGMLGSSSLENDADQVVLIDHSRYSRNGSEAELFLLLAKNRHGPAAEWPTTFDYRTVRMRERLPDEERAYKVGV